MSVMWKRYVWEREPKEKEIEGLEKQHRKLTGAKARLGQQMDSLDIMDKFYEKKYQDMETRLYRLYGEIEGVENSIEEVKNRLLNIQQQKISEENKTSINFFYILINYMISSPTWRRKNFLTALWNRWTFTSRSSRMADS